jgi:hypothetical protein
LSIVVSVILSVIFSAYIIVAVVVLVPLAIIGAVVRSAIRYLRGRRPDDTAGTIDLSHIREKPKKIRHFADPTLSSDDEEGAT